MKKGWLFVAFLALIVVLVVSGCGQTTPTSETPAVSATQVSSGEGNAPIDILGMWILKPEGAPNAKTPPTFEALSGEIYEAGSMEVTPEYLIFGNLGNTYSWIDDHRIRIDGVGSAFSSFNNGFFYVVTVQRKGNVLYFLLADGTPFVAFSAQGD